MNLDFSRLNELAKGSALMDFKDETEIHKIAQKGPVEAEKTPNKLQIQADQKKAEIERNKAIYDEYQENTQTAQTTMNKITLGVKQGENIYSLFLEAVKVIALMTHDKAFDEQINDDIRAIYGIGLQKPKALKLELTDIKKRLDSLQKAKDNATDHDESRRIDTAIKAHKKRIRQIEHMMKG